MAVAGKNQGGLSGFAKQAAGATFGSLAALWTKENAATTAVMYDGIVYMFKSEKAAKNAARSIEGNSLHSNIYVAYSDKNGQIKWMPRQSK